MSPHAIAHDVVGAGPPVVFIHGLTSSRASWSPVVERLRGEFTCVRVDLRGHGETPEASDYAMPALVADVHAVVTRAGLVEPAVVGHSLGATVAAVYAASFSPRAVVCVDQSLRFGDFATLVQPYAERLRGPGWADALLEIERAIGVDVDAAFERQVRAFDPEVLRGMWAAMLDTPPHELTAIAESVLPGVTAPLLSIHGSAPAPGYEAWLTGVVPTARLEVWDGTGHRLHRTDPDRFAARLRTFLA